MKYIYVLEDETRIQKEIFEALRLNEPQAQIRFFQSLEDFHQWMAVALKEGNKALFQGGLKLEQDNLPGAASADPTDELILLISKEEWLGSRYVHLIKKTIEAFVRKKICTAEDPTRMVITSYESPDFEFHLVEDPIISNVIFKPFDELILRQHLHFALKGHHAPSQNFVYKVQTSQEVEMTKEVRMEAAGDIGFVTVSPVEIKVGKISKYYGEVFKGKGRTHVMGRCLACEPHPDLKGQFRVWFSYFGIPSSQISDIRKNIVKRHEVEFSGNAPFKPQPPQLEWIILDGHKERVAKYKKILETVAEAKLKVFTSFESFLFQTDPLVAENSRKEAPWTDTDKLVLHLDTHGDQVLKVLPEEQEKKKILGEPYLEFKKASFRNRILESCLGTFKHWLAEGKVDQELIIFYSVGQFYTLKATRLSKNKTDKGQPYIEIEFVVPTIAERTSWVQKNFPTPHMAHAILIAKDFVPEERLTFWEEFVKTAQSKGGDPRFMLLSQQVPDEKFTRKLNWVEEIFEESNDSAYIERKLRWRCGVYGLNSNGEQSVFLSQCQEEIRVANPVETAELSEASLILNYYRPIESGAFRKFVFAKTSETYNEYRARCNFSVEHPTEKGMFQPHFVFFGITDGHLKGIRLWILDNYIEGKKDEG